MQNEEANRNIKVRNSLIAIIAAVVIVIVTLSIVGVMNSNRDEAKILNESSRGSADISNEDLSTSKKLIHSFVNKINNTENANVEAMVRWDTLEKDVPSYGSGTTTFLVDLDQYKQTYRIIVSEGNTFITCPKLVESKYPESFCIGNRGDSDNSFTLVFGANLPYTLQTSEDETIAISKKVEQKTGITNGILSVQVYSCSSDDSIAARAEQVVDEYIASLGASPNIFKKEISITCPHGE